MALHVLYLLSYHSIQCYLQLWFILSIIQII
jgi:hypothetical protein